MSDTDRKEESWIRKLPTIIAVLAVLIFIIIVFRDHSQYIKWKQDQSELTEKIQQTSEELALLKDANGALEDVTRRVGTIEQQAADMTATLEELTAEKNNIEDALSKLRPELSDLNEQVSASRNKVTELMKENATLKTANHQLRDDIVNKKSVLDSIAFLQRQKSVLERNIQDLATRHDLAVKAELEQQARLDALQNAIKEGETAIQAQKEQRTALGDEMAEMTETLKQLSSQKEKLEYWDDLQKRLEYLEFLQNQKESLEISINNLMEIGKKLEEENSMHQQNIPAR